MSKQLFKKLDEQNILSRTIIDQQDKIFNQAIIYLCNVLDQFYNGYAEEETGIMRTQFNADAEAVWFLKEHGVVEIIEGEWPKTKYISFKFKKGYGIV